MKPLLGSLNRRMIAFLSLLLGASLAVTTLLSAHMERSCTLQIARDKVKSFAEAVQANMFQAMEEGRCGDVPIIIRTLASPKEFMMVRIFDKDGKILESTKPDEKGETLDATMISLAPGNGVVLNHSENGGKTFSACGWFCNELKCWRCHGEGTQVLGYLNVVLSLDPIETQLRSRTMRDMASASAVLLMMCVATFFFFRRFVSRRVQEVSGKLTQVVEGNLDVQLPVRSGDELSRLAESFNHMVKNLHDTRVREQDQKRFLQIINEDLRARIDEVNTLYEATRSIGRSLRLEEILRMTLENVTRSLGFDRVVLSVFDEARGALTGKWAIGIDEEIVRQVSISKEDINGVLCDTIAGRRPILVQDTSAHPIVDRRGSKTCWEMLKCGQKDCPVFRNPDLRCWMVTGTRCNREMAEYTFEERMRVCRKCSYFNQEIIRRSDVVNLLLFGSHAFISVPLIAREQVMGVLLADKLHSEKKEITEEDIRMIVAFMSHVSVAVENADLYQRLETKVDLSQRQLQEANEQLREMVEELSEIRSFNETILQHLSGGIINCAKEGAISFVNRAGAEFLGWHESELLGRSIHEVLCGREDCVSIFRKDIEKDGGFAGETEITKRNGERVPAEIFLSPLRDKDGNVTGNTWIFRDITEKRKIEARMRRMDKLASLGQLASGLAHEIKNPLAGIGSAIQVLSAHIQLDDEKKEVVKEILKQIHRLDGTIKNLLSFARPSQPRLIPTDPNEIVEAVIFLVSQQLKTQNIQVSLGPLDALPNMMVDPQQIQQALLNVVLNAMEAMPSGGSLEISVREKAVELPSRKEQLHISLVVRDTGAGIPEEAIPKIFNPFYTTKPVGTGLGLSITQWIIEQHNGAISVKSEAGKGTCFIIDLPI